MLEGVKHFLKRLLLPRKKLLILNYHQVSDRLNPKIHNQYIWNEISFFEKQMLFLKKEYKMVSLKEGLDRLRKGSINETMICLTFDDGDASIQKVVMPLLSKLEIPATFFINTAYGKEKFGYWYNLGPYLNDQKLIQSSQQIRNTNDPSVYHHLLKLENEINKSLAPETTPFYSKNEVFMKCTNPLFHFGLHGHEHLRFSMLSYDSQKENLMKNIEEMKNWPNYIPFFAIPFGQPRDWNKQTLEVAKELDVTPLLAYQGYNVSYRSPLLRFSVDGMNLKHVLENLSPFPARYYKRNNLK